MIVVSGIRLPLGTPEEEIPRAARDMLGRPEGGDFRLRRVSYDMRRGRAELVCSVTAELGDRDLEKKTANRCQNARFVEKEEFAPQTGTEPLQHRPVVVGFGPAGMFAAYLLAEYGYRPIVLERGADLDSRVAAVEGFFSGGDLDPDSNIQFGEGGAGTFSDGKLTTRINDGLCDWVLDAFVKFGAPESIKTRAKPHIGTDNLRAVVKAIRQSIIEKGGEVRFLCPVTDIAAAGGTVTGLVTPQGMIPASQVILACGHSARDTFGMLAGRGAVLSPKPFSVGFRIEHLQQDVDRSLYGDLAGDPRLPKGEYSLSAHVGDRGVYTFCMCPGGQVVAAASERSGAVTNGMSSYARDGRNANSAVCVSVDARDFGRDPMRAMEFQRSLERVAFAAGGGGYRAPASSVSAFLEGKGGLKTGKVEPTYPRGVRGFDLEKVLGTALSGAMRTGLRAFGLKLECFKDPNAVLTGVETRTSSPVRVERGEDRQALGIGGLYPCGEGAGYAGGIMSAAVDGMHSAMELMKRFRPYT